MGMFNDTVSAQRTHWQYTYSGKELLPYAKKLLEENDSKETTAREAMSKYMLDKKMSNAAPEVKQAERDIVTYGTMKEQCKVFAHEFKRNPDKMYELGLGDITFFGMAE